MLDNEQVTALMQVSVIVLLYVCIDLHPRGHITWSQQHAKLLFYVQESTLEKR